MTPEHSIAKLETGPKRGTGFAVAPNLLLTALHVVAERRPLKLTRDKITARFPDGAELEATIIKDAWHVEEDWVLLRCNGMNRPSLPVGMVPARNAAWTSYGYPETEATGFGLRGTIVMVVPSSGLIQLYSEEAAAGKGAEMRGISGAPCLVDGRVVGHIVEQLLLVEEEHVPAGDRMIRRLASRNVAGTLYACPYEKVAARAHAMLASDELPLPDPYWGLPAPQPRDLPSTPFRILHCFTSKDAEIFFGRGRKVRQLYQTIVAPGGAPVVLLHGQSGAGKSSLLDAGLRPRIEHEHHVVVASRQAERGLRGTLEQVLQALPDMSFEEHWRTLEAQHGKPMIVILDQAEECFTHPRPGAGDELADLCRALRAIFGGEHRPKGRIVISFRKDWYPEFRGAMDLHGVSFQEVFVERLSHDEIVDAIMGPVTNPRLAAHFRLEIADGLAGQIARDLLTDRDSPVATILQLVLGRLWERVDSDDRRKITMAGYETLKKERFDLGSFLDRQLAALASSDDPWLSLSETSGLALDVLYYHTTPLATAQTRARNELWEEYGHHAPEDLNRLVTSLKELYLIAEPPSGPARQTRLAHDTLAPVVIRAWNQSTRPGQLARRILEQRALG